MTQPLPQPTLGNWLSILALGVIWGGAFMMISLALRSYGPLTVACARTSLGALMLLGLCFALKRKWPERWSKRLIAFTAFSGLFSTAIPFFLLSWGQQYVPSAFAGLSMAALPLFMLPMAHFLVPGERLTWRKTAGFSIGFIGALVLLGEGVFAAGTGDLAALGRVACLAAALCYALSSIATRLCPPIDTFVLTAVGLAIGSAVLLPIMLLIEGVPQIADPLPMFAILFLGLVPTGLANLLRVSVVRSAGPTFMTLVNYQVPVWSVIFGAMILGESLANSFFIALSLIFVGLIVSQWTALKGIGKSLQRASRENL